jgi:hypothetical protein
MSAEQPFGAAPKIRQACQTAAPNGGSARDYLPGFAWLFGPVMVQRASGCPYVYAWILGVNVRI